MRFLSSTHRGMGQLRVFAVCSSTALLACVVLNLASTSMMLSKTSTVASSDTKCTFCEGREIIFFNPDWVVPEAGAKTCGAIKAMAAGHQLSGSDIICATIQKEESVCCPGQIIPHKKTAVVIFTHLINAHPSLDPLMTIYNGTKLYLNGLPEKAPYIITVDGIKDVPKNLEGELFLMESQENRNKYDEYIRRLQIHFKDHDNVKILVAGKNIGLANNIRRVIDNLPPETKYMYLFQHDLPLVREINHTDILATAEANDKMRLVGFKGEHPINRPCGDDITSEGGVFYRRFKQWTDRNHFVRVDHYKNDILPKVTSNFPEDNMHKPTRLNCTYFAPYYYEAGKGDPYYEHTDASERYGFKLFERVKRGELPYSSLSKVNIMIMKQAGVNMTKLEQYKNGPPVYN